MVQVEEQVGRERDQADVCEWHRGEPTGALREVQVRAAASFPWSEPMSVCEGCLRSDSKLKPGLFKWVKRPKQVRVRAPVVERVARGLSPVQERARVVIGEPVSTTVDGLERELRMVREALFNAAADLEEAEKGLSHMRALERALHAATSLKVKLSSVQRAYEELRDRQREKALAVHGSD